MSHRSIKLFAACVVAVCASMSTVEAAVFSDGSVFFEDFTSPSNALNTTTWGDISNDAGSTLTVSGGLMSITTTSSGTDRSIIVNQPQAFNLGAITQPAYEARFRVTADDDLDNIDGGSGPGNRNGRVFIGSDTTFTDFIFALGVRNGSTSGTFDIVENGNMGAPLLSGLNRNQFYIATVVYNTGTTRYDLYLDGNPVAPLETLNGTIGRPTRIYTGDTTGGSQYQGLTIDYFKVGNAVPEPASISLLALGAIILRRKR